MRAATLDRLLAVLVFAVVATGGLTLRTGAPSGGWVFVLHDILAGALAVTVALKLRASVPRAVSGGHWARLALGLALSVVVVAALVGGYAWAASGRLLEVRSWTVLTLHAWAGLALLPVVAVHLAPRRWRMLRPPRSSVHRSAAGLLSRRSLLVGGGLATAGIAAFGASRVADRLAGGERRFTGSRWLPSGGIPPTTTFLGDTPPPVDAAEWRIAVTGRVDRPRTFDLAALGALPQSDITAVLDCTSGWALETGWRGTPLAAVLDVVGAARDTAIEVRSATGWTTSLPVADARRALLATEVAGVPLPVGNGAPVRLVVPDHRGLDWVKWVTGIRVV